MLDKLGLHSVWFKQSCNQKRLENVSTVITTLTVADISAVDHLMKRNSATLGFLPEVALCDYLTKGNVLGALDEHNRLVGYLLYGASQVFFRIGHLCVAEESRGQGIARRLVEALKKGASTQKTISLNCRRDFPANALWPKLGFIPLGEKRGRSKAGHSLTHWCLTLTPNDQLSLFQAAVSSEATDVVIDAQIFFDLLEAGRNKADISSSLLSGFLVDSINLCITDELLVEIDRNTSAEGRQLAREFTYDFRTVAHDIAQSESLGSVLGTILPSKTPRALSDVRHLAKAAAAGVKYFVTRDRRLLREAPRVSELTTLQVLSPSELIVKTHEILSKQSYAPGRVSGLSLEWKRLNSAELSTFPYEAFLTPSEGKGALKGKLERYLADPIQYACEALRLEGLIAAIRVHERDGARSIIVHLVRAASSMDRGLFESFLVADSIRSAVETRVDMVEVRDSDAHSRLEPLLSNMGFTYSGENYIRFCFSRCFEREEILTRISELSPKSEPIFQSMTDLELQRKCSPAAVRTAENYFLVPIRPGFALSLVDRQQSANDLFGGTNSVFLRWDHVYYRRNTHYRMLRPPGRILWYVSGDSHKRVVAISHLDSVEVGSPRELFRQFKQSGILNWDQIFEMCDGRYDAKIMALAFSNTFPLREPITLDELRTTFAEDGDNLVLQSPSRIPPSTYYKLFQLGFPA